MNRELTADYLKERLQLTDEKITSFTDAVFWLPRAVYKIYCLFAFIVSFALIFPLFYVTLLNKKWHKITFELKRFYAIILQLIGGVVLIVEQEEELPKDTACVICSNHSSYIDILLLYRTIPSYFVFMGKKELEKAPLLGKFFTSGMNISVDRSSKVSSHRAFLKACEEIDRGHNVVIFPEATIPKSAPKMIPFKNGAFKLAIEKQVPVVPITYTSNWKLLQGSIMFKGKAGPGLTKAIIHKPILTKGMTQEDVTRLKQMTFESINKALPN